MTNEALAEVMAVYEGSNGDLTKALYQRLEAVGPIGVIAMNLFRAQKCSERAKVYRGRRYKDAAYGRKQWSMDNLAAALTEHAEALGIAWGWAIDPEQAYHNVVLYIEIPTGQVSFHTDARGKGPNYLAPWDGVRGISPTRICRFCADVLAGAEDRRVAA